jgi:hypothetical protein
MNLPHRSMRLIDSIGLPMWLMISAVGCGTSSTTNPNTAMGGQAGSQATGGATGGAGSPSTPGGAGSGGTQSTGGSASGAAGTVTGGAGGQAGAAAGNGGVGGATAGAAGAAGTAGAAGQGGSVGTGCTGSTLCFDFEEGQVPAAWTTITNQGAGSLAIDNTNPHAGTYSLHVMGASGDGSMHSIGLNLADNFGGVMWGRMFVQMTPEGPAQHGGMFKARYADADDTAFGAENLDWYEAGLGHGSFEAIWHSPQPPSGLPEWEMISETPVTLDQWFCEESLFDGVNAAGTEAALPRIWIDGAELTFPEQHQYPGDAPPPTFHNAANFIMIELGLIMYHPLDSTTDLWVDDLAIGPERIGCQ